MIDTGSTRSFIAPEIAHKHFQNKLEPETGTVHTTHGFTKYTQRTLVPCDNLFNQKDLNLPFILFDFHGYFHMLIGLDNLKTLKALVNLNENLFQTPKVNIPMEYYVLGDEKSENHCCHETFLIEARSICQIPIKIANMESGSALLCNAISPGIEIPNCLITVKNSKAYVHATNAHEVPVRITLNKPLSVEPINDLMFLEEEPPQPCRVPPTKTWVDYSRFRLDHLNPEERKAIQKLIRDYDDLFQDPDEPLSAAVNVKHHIRTTDEIPVFVKPYRYPYVYKEEVQNQLDKLVAQKIIRPSDSPYNAPLWIVPKKMDASNKRKFRLVIDYRRLNEKTLDDKFPLPNICELLDKLGKCTFFSTLDLANGFHQLNLSEESIPKTAFSSDNNHYEFTRMPFGLKNAPATFQRLMNSVLRGINGELALVYLDDILIFSSSLQEHIDRLRQVFDRLRAANLKIQVDKTEFLRKELLYLGHVITPDGVRPNPDKIQAVKDFPKPKTKTEIKRFLGLLGYYRRFIKDFATITKPMTAALKDDPKITHESPEFITSFETCRTLLCNSPILQYPDFEKPFFVTTDCSNVAAGAVLSQNVQGNDLPVAYASKTLSEAERRYSTIEKELFAIIFALKTFRPYLYGRKFTLFTDHRPLQWLFSLKDPNSKLYKWRVKISDYNFSILYKPGRSNYVADALSRIELNNLEDETQNQTPSPFSIPNLPSVSPESRMDIDQIIAEAISTFEMPVDSNNPLDHVIQQPIDSNRERQTIHEITSAFRRSRENQSISESLIANSENTTQTNQFSIPTKDEAVNHGQSQIIIKFVNKISRKPKIEKLFGTKTRIICEISKINLKTEIINFVKEYVRPKIKYSIYLYDDDSFNKFLEIMTSTFKESQIQMQRCTSFLTDVQTDEEILETIRNYHVGKMNHRGIEETYQHIRRLYFWPNQKTKIQNFINQCDICLRSKYERNPLKIKFNVTPTSSRPFQTLHIDKIALEKSKFLSVLDPFSKFAQLYRVQSNNSIEVVNTLIQYFSAHGTPEKIISDNGAEFNSALVKELLALHGIEIHFVSSQHPESNGAVERFHSTLIEHIRLLNLRTEFQKETIETKVKYALLAYNNSIHSVTGLTPLEIVQGHIADNSPLKINLEQRLVNDYITKHRDRMVYLYRNLQENLEKNKETTMASRNKTRENPPELPDTIYVKNRQLQGKTKTKYNQETVEQTISPTGTLQIIPRHHNTQTKIHVSNVKRPRKIIPMKPFNAPPDENSSSSYSPSEASSQEQRIRAYHENREIREKTPRKLPSGTSSDSSLKPIRKKPRKALPCPPDTPQPGPSTSIGSEYQPPSSEISSDSSSL